MSEPRFLTILCHLVQESEKALRLHWDDPDNEMDLTFWIPKKCIEEDDFDREIAINKLKSGERDVLVDVAIWWLRDQEWCDESIEELIAL